MAPARTKAKTARNEVVDALDDADSGIGVGVETHFGRDRLDGLPRSNYSVDLQSVIQAMHQDRIDEILAQPTMRTARQSER